MHIRVGPSDVFLTAGARAYQKHVLHGPETVSIFVLHRRLAIKYGTVEFNIPLDTLQVILETVLRVI